MDQYFWKTTGENPTISRLKGKRKDNAAYFSKQLNLNSLDQRSVFKRVVPDPPADEHQRKDLLGMVKEFGSKTSLMGVGHVFTRKGWWWKLFWLVISLVSAAMALVQSWRILQDFVGGKSVQSTTYNTVFDFPSVTVCSNIHLHFKKREYLPDEDFSELKRDNLSHLIFYLEAIIQKENDTGESLFGAPIQWKQCQFNRKDCNKTDDKDYFFFDTLMYGNCFTYNMATVENKISRPSFILQMKLVVDKFSRRLEWNDNFMSVWLHPPATAPVLYRHEGIHVYPGDSVDIKFHMKKISRLTKKGNECVDPEKYYKRYTSIFYSKRTPYLYTTKACTYSMLYEAKKEMFGCLDPAVPRNDLWKDEWKSNNYNICLPGTNTESQSSGGDQGDDEEASEPDLNFEQNCTFPCTEWMVEYTVTSTSAWFEALIDKSLKASSTPTNKTAGGVTDVKFENRYAEVKVGLGAPMTEEVKENYKYTLGDFAGIIGGNIGIWIGLCAISLAEVIELLINMAIEQFRRMRQSAKDKNSGNVQSFKVQPLVDKVVRFK